MYCYGLNCITPRVVCSSPTLRDSECDLFWSKDLYRGDELKQVGVILQKAEKVPCEDCVECPISWGELMS